MGLGFDGSSIRGFQAINESDMLIFPDPDTAIVDPVYKIPTLSLIGNIKDPITLESYSRDVRHIAQKAEAYLRSTGIADTSYWGPEAEFFVFNDVQLWSEISIQVFMPLTPLKGVGIQAPMKVRTSGINRAIRKAISPFRHRIHYKIFDLR